MFKLHSFCALFLIVVCWVSARPMRGKYFDRVVIIVLENQRYEVALNNTYLSGLTSDYKGFTLTNYMAITHPSQPNYIALVSGSSIDSLDDLEVNINRSSIIDLLESKGISWKTYQQDYPGSCHKEMRAGPYARKHNPFISFVNIQSNESRCNKIVNSNQLDNDIQDNNVPQFVFYTPNMNNDAHDTDMDYASKWLKGFLSSRIHQRAFSENTMFVVTFDEDDGSSKNNKVFTTLFGPDFHPSSKKKMDNTSYNHYSLLRTIEDNWHLGDLGQHDQEANRIEI